MEIPLQLEDANNFSYLQMRFFKQGRLALPVQVVWSKVSNSHSTLLGIQFRDGTHMNGPALEEILANFKLIDPLFMSELKQTRAMLQRLKFKCDQFDQEHPDEKSRIHFLETIKQEAFAFMDHHCEKIWMLYLRQSEKLRLIHRQYSLLMLEELLDQPEVNRHIYQKPLGYPGDFLTMNYIYSFHAGSYLGQSTYERLINHYTCNIPISCSNIGRMKFIKKQILEVLENREEPSILSVGAGPLLELIELLHEGKITKPLSFRCVDFEPAALAYIQREVAKVSNGQRSLLSIDYVLMNIVEITRNKKLRERLGRHDLIYASGVFDYLSNRMASSLINQLYSLVRPRGKLIVINASQNTCSHRAYYELVGQWDMYYRTEVDMLNWIKDPVVRQKACFKAVNDSQNYLYLFIDH